MLRANLRYFNIEREVGSILVTSGAPQDGKTMIAWNVSRAEAGAGRRVLCIEADLRRPTLAEYLDIAPTEGLGLVLAGAIEPWAAIRTVQGVDLLPAGPLPPNPGELLESRQMTELLAWAEATYDRVIIDTPPAAVVADALPLFNQVGGVVVVARLRKSTREASEHLRDQLKNMHAPLLGLVVNGASKTARDELLPVAGGFDEVRSAGRYGLPQRHRVRETQRQGNPQRLRRQPRAVFLRRPVIRRAENRGERIDLLGSPLDVVDMDEAVARCIAAISSGEYLQHMSINAAKVVSMQRDEQLRHSVAKCGLVTADGQSIVWAARVFGHRLPERVAGIDLMERMLGVANQKGYRVYILGARSDVLEAAVGRLRARYPKLDVAGTQHGYFSDADTVVVVEAIRSAKPDILFVAMSSPRKEYFLGTEGASLGASFAMGVGGSVDVIAGVTRRAPVLLQRTGLEWAYRMAQEPRRLGRRYVIKNAGFVWLVLRTRLTRRGNAYGAASVAEPAAGAEIAAPDDPAD